MSNLLFHVVPEDACGDRRNVGRLNTVVTYYMFKKMYKI